MLDMMNTYNFPVETQDIFDQHGQPITGHKAAVRTDTNEVLGVHGSRYKIINHDDVVNSVLDGVHTADIGKDYDLKVDVFEGGRKLRGEILFNDLTIEPTVNDYVKFRISFFNSYDGSWAFSQAANGLRLWCMNGCTTPDKVAYTRHKHTASVNVDGSAMKVINGLEHFINQKDVWKSWMHTRVSSLDAEQFFKKTVAKLSTRQQDHTKTNEKQLENLLSIWSGEVEGLGPNKWALYNCLTYWATHTSDLRNPDVTRRNREDMIARAMSSNHWKAFV